MPERTVASSSYSSRFPPPVSVRACAAPTGPPGQESILERFPGGRTVSSRLMGYALLYLFMELTKRSLALLQGTAGA